MGTVGTIGTGTGAEAEFAGSGAGPMATSDRGLPAPGCHGAVSWW